MIYMDIMLYVDIHIIHSYHIYIIHPSYIIHHIIHHISDIHIFLLLPSIHLSSPLSPPLNTTFHPNLVCLPQSRSRPLAATRCHSAHHVTFPRPRVSMLFAVESLQPGHSPLSPLPIHSPSSNPLTAAPFHASRHHMPSPTSHPKRKA